METFAACLADGVGGGWRRNSFCFSCIGGNPLNPFNAVWRSACTKTIKKWKSQLSFQTLLDIKWFINLFIDYLKKWYKKRLFFIFLDFFILNFNIEFKCNTKYFLSLIHLSQSLFLYIFFFFFCCGSFDVGVEVYADFSCSHIRAEQIEKSSTNFSSSLELLSTALYINL